MWGSPELCYTSDRKAPDWFVKELKQYDDKLFVRWNNLKKRFEIWRKVFARVGDPSVHVMAVKHKQLDDRTLDELKACDLWRYGRKRFGRVNDYMRDIDNYNDHLELSRTRQFQNECEGIASDHLWFAAKRFFGNPKTRALYPSAVAP